MSGTATIPFSLKGVSMKDFINRNIRWVFPLPATIFVILMMVFPVLFTFGISFTNWSMSAAAPTTFVGLNNYITMFQDPRFYASLWQTLYLTVLAVSVETVLGVLIAVLLNQEFVGKNVVKTMFLLPMVSTPVAIGLCWTLFYEPTVGLFNYALKQIGLPSVAWLANTKTVIPAIALVDIWQWTPMIILIVMAGLAGLPTECLEAAEVDGATPFQKFRLVTLPLLSSTILTAVLLRTIDAVKTFDIIFSMTNGGPLNASENLNVYAYKQGFQYFQFGSASTLLVMLFLLVLGCTLLTMRLKKGVNARV